MLNSINKLSNIAFNSIRENLRNRLYYLILIFGVILLFFSMLAGILGAEWRGRILIDFGLASIEVICLFGAIFIGTTLIVDEISNKLVYFPLSRPVSRTIYLLGKYFGLLLSIKPIIISMCLIHIAFILYGRYTVDVNYLIVAVSIILKTLLMCSIALFFSVFTTSKVSAFVMSFLFLLLGHFSQELILLAKRATNVVQKYLIYAVYYVLPNFHILNWKDVLGNLNLHIFITLLYLLLYIPIVLALSAYLFNRKEI